MSVDNNGREIPLSWFTRSLWKYTPLYIELVFLAICLRLIGLVEPFIFQGLCCTNRLMVGIPLSPDRLIPRAL